MRQLVSTEWLEKNLDSVKILDATMHMPTSGRNAQKEFKLNHIKNSIFFDIDKYSNQNTTLPHMLPAVSDWEINLSNLGINNSDHVIVYDNSELFSACRVWFSFIYFGHSKNLISVLDGGFEKWQLENRPISNKLIKYKKSNYKGNEDTSLVIDKNQIDKNITNKSLQLIDARNEERFLGNKPEPRAGLRPGHIKGSKNLYFQMLVNKDRTFKKKSELISIFKKKEISLYETTAFTCGSGITACVLGLANSLITDKSPIVYDGSWSEYGIKK